MSLVRGDFVVSVMSSIIFASEAERHQSINQIDESKPMESVHSLCHLSINKASSSRSLIDSIAISVWLHEPRRCSRRLACSLQYLKSSRFLTFTTCLAYVWIDIRVSSKHSLDATVVQPRQNIMLGLAQSLAKLGSSTYSKRHLAPLAKPKDMQLTF